MPTPRRFLPVLLLFFCLGQSGCGTPKALRITLTGLNAARDGFIAYDMQVQTRIVSDASSFEMGRIKLDIYRAEREKVILALEIAYKALATAAVDPSELNITGAVTAAREVIGLVQSIQEKVEK